MSSWDYIAIAGVLIAGVPHGGFDGAVARRSGWPLLEQGWILFHASYLLLAVLVAIAWLSAPGIVLTLFLLISAIHFGASDIRAVDRPWQWHCILPLTAHSGLVCIAIPGLHPDLVLPLFNILVGETAALSILKGISYLIIPWLLVVTIYLIYACFVKHWKRSAFLLAVLLVGCFWLDPLVSFAIYFCFIHSPQHSLRIWRGLIPSDRKRCFIEAAAYTLAAWIMALLLMALLNRPGGPDFDSLLIQLTFVGLASLTVPHMILVDLIDLKND